MTDGTPGGPDVPLTAVGEEQARAVAPVLDRILTLLDDGDVVAAAHGHVLRVLDSALAEARPGWRSVVPAGHRNVSTLGFEHGQSVITSWNLPAPRS